jgi:hypothetical protein
MQLEVWFQELAASLLAATRPPFNGNVSLREIPASHAEIIDYASTA